MVRAAPQEHYDWLCSRLGCARTPGFKAIEYVDSKGNIRGMVGYDWWTENSVGIHIFLETWAAGRKLIRPAFEYPFAQANKGVVWAHIAGANYKSRKLAAHLGFEVTGRIDDGIKPGEDMIVYQMRKDQCRWLQ
jgi:RimJ/RimL family protein N-acetyltransferase